MIATNILSRQQLATFQREGYVICRALLATAICEALLERVDGILDGRYSSEGFHVGAASTNTPDDPGRKIRQILLKSWPIPDPVLAALGANEALLGLASELFEGKAELFQQQALAKEAGVANGTPWHQDAAYWGYATDYPRATAWIPLVATAADSGTMWVMPGSHNTLRDHVQAAGVSRFQTIANAVDDNAMVPLELNPGDVSFHDHLLVHGAYDNNGQRRRVAIAQHYQPLAKGSNARSKESLIAGRR